MGKPGPSFISQNTSRKMFNRTDNISEIVNDSDSDGCSFSELSDRDMCKVNLPFSSNNEEEEIVQPEPDRGRNRTHWSGPPAWGFDEVLTAHHRKYFTILQNISYGRGLWFVTRTMTI